jgi:hypothetical protein
MKNAARSARTFWETSGDGKTRRLVREFYVDGKSVGFEVAYSETVPA